MAGRDKAGLLLPGQKSITVCPGSPCFTSMAPPHPFFFTSRTSGCLFVHHRLLHLNTLDAPAVSVMNFPLHFSEHQYKSLDLCCASWDFCRAPHQNLCLVFSSINSHKQIEFNSSVAAIQNTTKVILCVLICFIIDTGIPYFITKIVLHASLQ